MSIVRSERAAALLLLVAAALGLLLANSPLGPFFLDAQAIELGLGPIELSAGYWISDGLLAIFFFVVAIELKSELLEGHLNSFAKAIRPAIAAAGGVLVPALLYLAVTAGSGYERGWPIPTATDIAFALGILAVFGRGIPTRLRVFLLALAILDDIVAIAIIAVFFTASPDLTMLLLGAICIVGFGVLSRMLRGRARVLVAIAMVALAIAAWAFVLLSGVHATIAGVGLGLSLALAPGHGIRHALEPVSNGVVLPLFAFSAALVTIPQVAPTQLAPPFWAIVLALPVGKLVGIVLGGWIASFVGRRGSTPELGAHALAAAGALGGIGFTVSLLMNELAFKQQPLVADEGTLAVLLGSAISIVASAVLVTSLARYHRRLRRLRDQAHRMRNL